MAGKLAKEIKQNKPFPSAADEAFLNVLRTAEVINQRGTEIMKPFDLTQPQYNALRILRGAGKDGITCSDLGERLINREPDVTRLLDRLQAKGLAERERSDKDRRIVVNRLTKAGADLLVAMEGPIAELTDSTARKVSAADYRQLIDLLEKVREALE